MDMDTPVNPCVVPAFWNIYQRINWVRSQLWYVQKTKEVQNYKVVTHDMVTAMLRNHLMKAGIITVPSVINGSSIDTGVTTKSGMPIIRYEAEYNIRFINAENPEDGFAMQVPAHANDQGDKAPGKATSYAIKVALLKLFNLETGEDEESRIEPLFKEPEYITEEQAAALEQRILDGGIDDAAFLKWLAGPPVKASSIDQITVKALPIVEAQVKRALERKK